MVNTASSRLLFLCCLSIALLYCYCYCQAVGGSLDAATDYLLNNPLPLLSQTLGGNFGPGLEQDELMRAIPMLLGYNVMVSTGSARQQLQEAGGGGQDDQGGRSSRL